MASITRNPVGRVIGYGSARHGLSIWMRERLTGLALVPLGLWFVFAAVAISGSTYEEARAWLGTPWNTTLMLLTVVLTFWHAKMGVTVIVEDYVHHELLKSAVLVLNLFLHALFGTACVVAVLKVSLGS
jgi:succinate dehydrogenase / fumarate reductase membrane anchor subunit